MRLKHISRVKEEGKDEVLNFVFENNSGDIFISSANFRQLRFHLVTELTNNELWDILIDFEGLHLTNQSEGIDGYIISMNYPSLRYPLICTTHRN